jgi:flagellar hook assembly protein FlgD
MQYLDEVPVGDYVLIVNCGNAYFSSWLQQVKDKLNSTLGADSLGNLSDGMSYILFGRKGDPNPIYENWAVNNTINKLIFNYTLNGINKAGAVTSTLIGPATTWGSFYHNYKPSEVPVTDSIVYKIIGVDITGKNVDTLSISQKDSLDLSTLPVLKNYPYIRLLAQVKDSANLTPPQLTRWQVIYGGVPEGTMNPDKFGKAAYAAVTKQEGDSLKVCFAFENISNYDFDTLTVKYSITNASKGVTTSYVKLTSLKKDTLITFCQTFSTKGLQGNNILQAYVNPQILKEQYYPNNVLEMPFTVISDKTHPILDVAFDGVHIMDGDLVSPSPMIAITLNDENKYLIRENSDGIDVYIQYPGQSVPVKVDPSNYTGKQVGVNGKNVYQIEYNPKSLADGKYILIVRAKDVAGNTSGVEDYKINFEVKNESSITNFYPYPNPFSSSTRFVFTITGGELPQDLKIQIMTVTGKVVREITMAEIGTLRIGNNKTDYAWDGTDEFGDKLANGVYLYRVIIKNASTYHHMNTAGDKAFKKDFGKLYILR